MKSFTELGVEYLHHKCDELEVMLAQFNVDMETLFQWSLFKQFGWKTNMDAFQKLSSIVPSSIVRHTKTNLTDLEAILFGQSGLLPEIPVDGYGADLLYRYTNFRHKYSLTPMAATEWKFMRMAPSCFPTIRISQIAKLLYSTDGLYAKCAGESNLDALKNIFEVSASEYWDDHFRFGVYSGNHAKQLNEEMITKLLVNTVARLRYFVGLRLKDANLKTDAIDMLMTLPPIRSIAWKIVHPLQPANALEGYGILKMATDSSDATSLSKV